MHDNYPEGASRAAGEWIPRHKNTDFKTRIRAIIKFRLANSNMSEPEISKMSDSSQTVFGKLFFRYCIYDPTGEAGEETEQFGIRSTMILDPSNTKFGLRRSWE
jgi:hypothetical protein